MKSFEVRMCESYFFSTCIEFHFKSCKIRGLVGALACMPCIWVVAGMSPVNTTIHPHTYKLRYTYLDDGLKIVQLLKANIWKKEKEKRIESSETVAHICLQNTYTSTRIRTVIHTKIFDFRKCFLRKKKVLKVFYYFERMYYFLFLLQMLPRIAWKFQNIQQNVSKLVKFGFLL